MQTEPKTCICYCRVSTAAQREADTIEAQLETCKRIVERNQLQLLPYGEDGFVIDRGVSGSLLSGRLFSKFLDDLEAFTIKPNYLVVYSLSRIARIDRTSKKLDKLKASHAAAARIQAVLIGCEVETWDQEGHLKASDLLWGVKILLASQEYKEIRGRTMDGKSRRLRDNCYAKGGKAPYGYLQTGEHKTGFKLEPHPIDSKNLLLLLSWYLQGGYNSAARRATEAEIPNPMTECTNRKKKSVDWTPTRWSEVSVQHIIKNIGAYLGKTIYQFNGQAYTLTYPPLIDPELYSRIINHKNQRTVKERTKFLATGFVNCLCGEHVHQKNTHNHHFARCPAGCGSMPESTFDTYLWTAVVCRLIQIREHEGAVTALRDYSAEINKLKAQIEAVDRSIASLLDLYLEDLDKSVWKSRNESLNQRKAMAQAELDKLQREIEAQKHKRATEQTLEQQLATIIKELSYSAHPSPERKRAVLSQLLHGDRIVVQFDPPIPTIRKDGGEHKKARTSPGALITLPETNGLPSLTVNTKEEIWVQILGKRSVADKNLSTEYAGQGHEAAEAALLKKLKAVNGRVISRTVRKDGVVVLTKEADEYPW